MGNTHMTKQFIFRVDNALDKMRDAFDELDALWDNHTMTNLQTQSNNILDPDYPFNGSFDDLAGDVRTWVGLCKGRLCTQLIILLKEEEQHGKIKRDLPEDPGF